MFNRRSFERLEAAVNELHENTLASGIRIGMLDAMRILLERGDREAAMAVYSAYLGRKEGA